MKRLLIVLFMMTIVCFLCNNCIAQKIEYKVFPSMDGGYKLEITGYKQSLMPVTAEGFFPKLAVHYTVELIGRGHDWSKQNQSGYYYSKQEVRGIDGELGYAWIDINRKYIYINFFWVSAPDKLSPSVINGKYRILGK